VLQRVARKASKCQHLSGRVASSRCIPSSPLAGQIILVRWIGVAENTSIY